ncbi:hypothetical protein HN954_01435 [bacterium]|jgi:hypothetical protein|nr:hypothetical protein [bacterium]MBT6832403.1 hypothetical protein [bacterium]MBT6996074.1 hypothetical protein [bacterium]MBT7772523.1 hypothetical protein [bacterium]
MIEDHESLAEDFSVETATPPNLLRAMKFVTSAEFLETGENDENFLQLAFCLDYPDKFSEIQKFLAKEKDFSVTLDDLDRVRQKIENISFLEEESQFFEDQKEGHQSWHSELKKRTRFAKEILGLGKHLEKIILVPTLPENKKIIMDLESRGVILF